MENYEIRDNYTSRDKEKFLSQKLNFAKDQKMTYKYAQKIAIKNNYKRITDVGCGSGYLLLQYFSDYDTIGYDLPGNIEWLKLTYPNRTWADPSIFPIKISDLVICADVIEHILEPNAFIGWIKTLGAKEFVFSTPQRDLLNPVKHPVNGPPVNKYHIREWNYEEFHKYMSRFFTIVNHYQRGIHQVLHATI